MYVSGECELFVSMCKLNIFCIIDICICGMEKFVVIFLNLKSEISKLKYYFPIDFTLYINIYITNTYIYQEILQTALGLNTK